MKLFHPIPNKLVKQVLDGYKGRKVHIYHARMDRYYSSGKWVRIADAETYLFDDAVKLLKPFPKSAGIEYQFIDELGTGRPEIKDYSEEDVYNCPSVSFDNNRTQSNE